MHLEVSNVPLLPVLGALLIVALLGSVQRRRGGSGGRGRSRSSAPRTNSRLGVAPNPRVAASRRLAAVQSGPFAAAQSITAARPFVAAPPTAAAQPLVTQSAATTHSAATTQSVATVQSVAAAQPFLAAQPLGVTQSLPAALPFADVPHFSSEPRDPFAAQPAAHLGAQPETRAIPETSWAVGPVASVSVLASFTEEADNARPNFAPSNSGDAFPTKARALALLGGHLLAALGILILSLASTPLGHHMSHVGGTSVGLLAVFGVLVGIVSAVVVAARVQHDIMGGGWYEGLSPRYISPQVALYVISPSGVSAAARRLRYSPARVIFVEYGFLVASVLILLDRFTAR